MKTGIHDITNAEYHASAGLSRSAICEFKRTPLHYWHKYVNPHYERSKPTEAMVFGEAVHTWSLEPKERWSRYYVAGKYDKRTIKGKTAWEEEKVKAGDRVAIDGDSRDELDLIAHTVSSHELAPQIIEGAQIEKSIYWTDEDTGLLCKCRPDIWGATYLADLKTSQDAGYTEFQRSIYKYNYQIQAAMLREGVKHATGEELNDFVFIVIEKKPPYAIACYTLDKAWIDDGEAKYKQLLKEIKVCIDNDSWPGYEVQNMCMPGWMG